MSDDDYDIVAQLLVERVKQPSARPKRKWPGRSSPMPSDLDASLAAALDDLVRQVRTVYRVLESMVGQGADENALRRHTGTILKRLALEDGRLARQIAETAELVRRRIRDGLTSWQSELRRLDDSLASGEISADTYRARRDGILAAAAVAPPASERQVPDTSTYGSGVGGWGEFGGGTGGYGGGTGGMAYPPPTLPGGRGPGGSPPSGRPQPGAEPVTPGSPGSAGSPPGGAQQAGSGPASVGLPPARRGSFDDGVSQQQPMGGQRPRDGGSRRRPGDGAPSQPGATERFLVAHLPARAPFDADVSLIVRICLRPANWATADARMFVAGGTPVSVLVQAPAGLLAIGPLEQTVMVHSDSDSEPVRFAFRTRALGPRRLRLMAFAGGTFLTELEVEMSVEPGGPSVDGEPTVARLADVEARQGEVTLQVRSEGDRTVFQLLSDTYLFEPVLAQATAGDPPAAVERAIGTLRQLAAGRGPYSAGMARRWMQETGIGLWQDVVPGLIKDQYWQLRDHVTSFTIATSHDVIPWELLYPLRPGADDGFMVEQFPVLRRVFGQQRCDRMSITPCTYVVSGQAPSNARPEIDTLTRVIGAAGVVDELDALLGMVGSGACGPLHFVCHNSFSSDSGSSIAMNGGPFVPGLLNSAVIHRTLATRSPLVFLNACRTAGTVPEYSRMIGWAQQFVAAGAGAFVGTLWPVRSESASLFAHAFYTLLADGESLGRAALLARRRAIQDEPDPTWLAYTVYGDPHAHAG